jgi:hypothetical protein
MMSGLFYIPGMAVEEKRAWITGAMAEADHFWIANALYLAFALSAVTESVSKIFAYRRGFQPW